VRLVAAFWLRPGNCSCANNVVGFFLDLWDNLPSHLRLRVVRADSGFYVAELLRVWQQLRVNFIVVARLTRPVQSLLRRETRWLATGSTASKWPNSTITKRTCPPPRASSRFATG